MKLKPFILLAFCLNSTVLSATELENFALPKPVLDTTEHSQVFLSREAKITAEEYPLAQQLKPMLEADKTQQAVNLIDQQAKKSPALWLIKGQLEMQLKQYKTAEKSLKAALKELPDLIRAHQTLTNLYHIQDNPDKARASLSKVIGLSGGTAYSYAHLGYLNMRLGDPVSAIAAYQQAVMLAPENTDNRRALIVAYTRSEQYSAALYMLDELLKDDPEQPAVWLQKASIAMELNKPLSALASLEAAIRFGYREKSAYQMAMQLHLKQDNFPRAVELSLKLLAKKQLKFAELSKLLGYLQAKQQWQQFARLLKAMEQESKQLNHSQLSRLYFYQGQYALHKNNTKTASTKLNKAVEVDATNGEALIGLAKLLQSQGKAARAELVYQRAEKLPSVKLEAMLARSQLYIDQQDLKAALTLLEKVHRDFPEQGSVANNIVIIRNILKQQA